MRKIFPLIFLQFFCLSVFSQNNAPTAVTDYVVTKRGHAIFNILANDFDIDGDSIYVFQCYQPLHGTIKKIATGVFEYNAFPDFRGGIDSLKYWIRDTHTPPNNSFGKVIFTVDNTLTYDSVSNNNICAGVNASGLLFSYCRVLAPYNTNFYPSFKVPKNSGINSIFSGNLWLGGLDSEDSLHMAANMYTYYGSDFWAGPVSDVYDSLYDFKYNRLWKITKADIDYHIAHCWQPNYIPSQRLIDWPGNGDVSHGQSGIIAPFYDNNHDGIYDPYSGDYPLIKGDEAVFFVYNDDRYPHMETGGKKLGIEVRAMLYAFDCPSDSALWNTMFLHFTIINQSSEIYHDTYVGTFINNDLGYPLDDYLGCDVQRGSFYSYNGLNNDLTQGGWNGYGKNPPAQSVTVLGGPFIDADGIDNPAGNCDESVNGLNFGNNIIDDERYGLSFSGNFFGQGGYDGITVPEEAPDYYNYLHGFWKDSIQFLYWGIGNPNAGGTGPVCRYLYPDNSDPCHYGTWGIDPGGTEPWTEKQANNPPYDRRSYGSSGPFTFKPGDIEEYDLAFVFGRNFTDSNATAAIPVMQLRIDSVRSYFIKDKTPCGGNFSGYKPAIDNPAFLYVYPNPTNSSITLEYAPGTYTQLVMFDILGNVLLSQTLTELRTHLIDLSVFRSGMYFLRVDDGVNYTIKKIIKTN
ncbi:MAG: T9SS type A sorting domain-containing protein [Bacteroidota bacterium]